MMAVTVYSTGSACVRCTMTVKVLAAAGIPHVEVDIRTSPAALEYITGDLGYTEAPVCVVEDGTGENHWSGFRPDRIKTIAAAR